MTFCQNWKTNSAISNRKKPYHQVFDVLLAWLRDCKIGASGRIAGHPITQRENLSGQSGVASAPSSRVAPEKMQHFQAWWGRPCWLSTLGRHENIWLEEPQAMTSTTRNSSQAVTSYVEEWRADQLSVL